MTLQHSHNNNQSKTALSILLIQITILCGLINYSFCKEMILIDRLDDKNQMIKMKLFQQISQYVQTNRNIMSEQYTCKSVLKNQLTKNYIENIEDLKIQIDYPKSIFMQGPIIPTFTEEQTNKIRKIDQILDLVKGKCLYYSTFTFLYQYCHKEHVRQFDNHATFTNNVKKQYQDISMGVFDPNTYQKRRQKWDYPPKTAQEKKKTLPIKYDAILENDHTMMKIESLHPLIGQVQLQQSQNGQLLHSNLHLTLSDNYLTKSPIILQLICQQNTKNKRNQIKNYALLATSFDLIYTLKHDKCHQLISYNAYAVDSYHHSEPKLRFYGNYLYGNVQQICTENWAWQKDEQNRDFNNQLLEGSVIVLQGYQLTKQTHQRHYLTIKKVYNGQLIELDASLGKSFYLSQQHYAYFSYSTLKSSMTFKNITKCQILFQERHSIDKILSKPKIFHNGLIKFQKEQPLIAQNNRMGCLCHLDSPTQQTKIIDFDIQLGKTPFDNIYQGYINTNSNIFSWKFIKKYIVKDCKKLFCFAGSKQTKSQSTTSEKNSGKLRKFTQIVKLSKKSRRFFNFTATNQQKIYIINIQGKGILKLITNGQDGQTYTYLISQGQIIRIRQFQNGTKEIIKENPYYENMTQIPEELRLRYIYLKVSKLKNGRYYGGIWKIQDYLYFPRFQLLDQMLISFQIISGYSYVRILDPVQMVKEQSLAIIQYFKKIEEIYDIKKQSDKKEEEGIKLDQSYKLSYEYFSGQYCDQPVNLFRRTLVTLKCGPSWFSIVKINQKSPCVYYLEIETKLLCREGVKQVVQEDQSILNGLDLGNGMFCHPKVGLYDQVFPYLYTTFENL